MVRGKHTRLFMPVAIALFVSGVVAAISNAGLFSAVERYAAAVRESLLHAAGLSHDGLTATVSWPLELGTLCFFSVLITLLFRGVSATRAAIWTMVIVAGLMLLAAAAAHELAVHLPVVNFAIATLCFAVLRWTRALLAALRRRRAHRRSRRPMETVVRHIIEHRILGIVTIDSRGMIGSMNPAAQVMLGYGGTDLSGTHVRHLLPEIFASADDNREIESILNVDGGAFETYAVRFGGDRISVEVTVTRLPVESGAMYSAFIRDLTVFRNQQRALEHQALHDSLTGLPNRTLFMRKLEEAIANSPVRGRDAGVAVLLLDLDRFKEVNNTLGHTVGDRALAVLAERLSFALPQGTTLARLGGDEFAVLLVGANGPDAAQSIAGRIRAVLEESIDVDSVRLELDGSVGVAFWPDHADSATQLMQRADVAMYAAKQTPARIAVYDAIQDENSLRRLTLSGDLRRAVREGQLFLQYQPKVDMKTRRLVGVEALVRWRHPEFGAVPPGDFIEHAELTGAIVPLSQWVLATAIERCAAWHAHGLEIDIAVNLSARLLLYPDLVSTIEGELARTGVDASRLVIEVTESALMSEPERAQTTLAALKALGVRLAIDDYGTGYSSLAYLSDLNADELKIDKRFVQFAPDNPNDRMIVESTIQLAHNLGLKVVAEGMEDERAYRLLRRLGCETGQGYYFAKPLSADEIVAWAHSAPDSRTNRRPRKAGRSLSDGTSCSTQRRQASAAR